MGRAAAKASPGRAYVALQGSNAERHAPGGSPGRRRGSVPVAEAGAGQAAVTFGVVGAPGPRAAAVASCVNPTRCSVEFGK